MTNEEIKVEIDSIRKKMESYIPGSTFILNEEVFILNSRFDELQKLCRHVFENGKCKYCYLKERVDGE